MIITSRENKIFKTAMALKTSKGRSENKMFLIEGVRSVRDAIEKGVKLSCLIIKDGTNPGFNYSCKEYTFAPKLFDEISETISPQGVIAMCAIKKNTLDDIAMLDRNCVVMCECLQDPGNIGTIIRDRKSVV